jgi:hypothetical protein
MSPMMTALWLLAAPSASASTHAAGATIENAATVDITPGGFDAVEAVLPSLVPASLPIDDLSAEDGWWCANYAYSLSGMEVGIAMTGADITPNAGFLDLRADLQVNVNDAGNPFELYVEALCAGDTCYGYVDPFTASISTTIALDVVTGSDGNPTLDATVGALNLSYDLAGEDIHLDDCWIGTVEEVFNWFGLSFYDLVLSLASSYLQSAISDFGPQIEEALEDAFAQATIAQQFDVNGITVDLDLYPSDVLIEPAGVRLAMNGAMSTDAQATCIAAYDPGGSAATFTDPPALGTAPAEVDSDYHVGLHLSDDIANQALYALWRGGLLCYTIDEQVFPVDTAVLGLLAGDAFDELFPESKPMVIETRPRRAPTLAVAGADDAGVVVEELGLEFYGELDHRQALILGMDLAADVGINLNLDLSGDDVVATVATNEFKADANADIEANFATVFDTLVGSLLGSMLEDLSFAMPAMEGIGLTDLVVASAGDKGDWMGVFTWIGPVAYGAEGCGGTEDGCGGGCSGGGCATGGRAPGRALLLTLPLALALVRRRRD